MANPMKRMFTFYLCFRTLQITFALFVLLLYQALLKLGEFYLSHLSDKHWDGFAPTVPPPFACGGGRSGVGKLGGRHGISLVLPTFSYLFPNSVEEKISVGALHAWGSMGQEVNGLMFVSTMKGKYCVRKNLLYVFHGPLVVSGLLVSGP